MEFTVKMLKNECWWGGSNGDGVKMPFTDSTELRGDFRKLAANDAAPLYISNFGRVIWSDKPFKYEIVGGEFHLEGEGEFLLETFGSTLKEAFLGAREKFFPINGHKLNRDFFRTVQYNTWIECLYDQNEEHILRYARAIIDNGFEPGILMIDEGWHGRYGIWEFDKAKFPNPKRMVAELHKMGFKVLLWVVPWVCPDGVFFYEALTKSNKEHKTDPQNRLFIRQKANPDRPAFFSWWNGFSAMLNMANKADYDFFTGQLDYLKSEYGIDGFKFDGGALGRYAMSVSGDILTELTPAELNKAWNKLAEVYEYHEFKDTFNNAEVPTVQRLMDRSHTWDTRSGLHTVIPCSIAQGLIGYPFICPDMVGGGDWVDFKPGKPIDSELFVRWAQASAFFPMMQYSKAPWDLENKEHTRLVLEAGRLHKSLTDEIIEMVTEAEQTGEPILRNLEYNYPNCGFAQIKDEYMLGERYLVAPVLKKGETERKVILPEGKWLCDDGKEYLGGEYIMNCPLDRLIYFKRIV